MASQHWATLSGEELAAAIRERFRKFEDRLLDKDLRRMVLATYAYYGEDEDGGRSSEVQRAGKGEQVRKLKDNQFRAVVQNKLTVATTEPPGFLPVPVNTDRASQATSLLARGLLDYYFDDRDVDGVAYQAAEVAEVCGWAWVDVAWDSQRGDVLERIPVADAEGRVTGISEVRAGDVQVEMLLPTDVAFDFAGRGERQWLILRRWRNKHDLAADVEAGRVAEGLDPEARAELAEAVRCMVAPAQSEVARALRDQRDSRHDDPDEVPVYELRHLPTPAVPGGRSALVVGDGLLVQEREHLYGDTDFGAYCISAGRRFGTPRGYTSAHDALGLQRAVDTLTSIPYSNQAALGLNILWAPEGSELRAEKIREGLVAIYGKVRDGKPEVLNLLQTKGEVFQYRKDLIAEIANLMGMDNLSMGREDRDLSGAAMALLDSRTQRAVSRLARAYARLRQEIGTAIIRRLRRFAGARRRVAMLAGKSKRPMLQDFSGEDLEAIDRVQLETISPLMRTPAGRLEIGNQLLAAKDAAGKPILTGDQYVTMIETGRYDPMTEGPQAERLTIREENERLMNGEALEGPYLQTAVFTDHPLLHIREHRVVLAPTAARRDPVVVGNVRQHMEVHIQHLIAWVSGDQLLTALHGPPPQEAVQAAQMLQAAQPAPGSGSPAGAGIEPPVEGARKPDMPTNPSTGQEYTSTGDVAHG